MIAIGTRPARPPDRRVRRAAPSSTPTASSTARTGSRTRCVVVGAGVIGIEYASMFAALGTQVTVVEQRQRLLEFCDDQIVEALQYHLRDLGVDLPLRRDGDGGREARRRHVTHARERQADRRRRGALLGRPPGRDRRRSTWRTPASRPTRAAASPSTTHYRTAVAPHLRGRRRDRLPQPRRRRSMEQGRLAACARVRPRRPARCASCSRSASTRSPRSASSAAPRRS